jgi:hypothetical protein
MAERKICSIDGCGNDVLARGMCRKHYYRWSRTGDAYAVRKTPAGKPLEYLLAHMYDGCCSPWPYARHGYGYPQVTIGGTRTLGHRVVCEAVNGPSPFDGAEVRHLCGKGHLGCFNADCLAWGSRSENHMDKVPHGTHSRGERNHMAKLTKSDVKFIRSEGCNVPRSELADKFGVHWMTIYRVQRGVRWGWI